MRKIKSINFYFCENYLEKPKNNRNSKFGLRHILCAAERQLRAKFEGKKIWAKYLKTFVRRHTHACTKCARLKGSDSLRFSIFI